MKMTTADDRERPLMADPPTGKISTICNQPSIGAMCCHNLYEFILQINMFHDPRPKFVELNEIINLVVLLLIFGRLFYLSIPIMNLQVS
jgi:hypothetical protein